MDPHIHHQFPPEPPRTHSSMYPRLPVRWPPAPMPHAGRTALTPNRGLCFVTPADPGRDPRGDVPAPARGCRPSPFSSPVFPSGNSTRAPCGVARALPGLTVFAKGLLFLTRARPTRPAPGKLRAPPRSAAWEVAAARTRCSRPPPRPASGRAGPAHLPPTKSNQIIDLCSVSARAKTFRAARGEGGGGGAVRRVLLMALDGSESFLAGTEHAVTKRLNDTSEVAGVPRCPLSCIAWNTGGFLHAPASSHNPFILMATGPPAGWGPHPRAMSHRDVTGQLPSGPSL